MSKVHKIRPILAKLYYQHNAKFTIRQNRVLIDYALDSIAEIIKHENLPNIVYGDCGDGIADSVLECDWFIGKHEPVDQYQGNPNIS